MCHFHTMIDCLAEFARDWVTIFSAIRPNLIGFHHKLATGSESVLTIKILRAKSFYSCSFLMHVVQIANPQYHLLPSLKFFGWYGLSDTYTKTWSGGLICVFVVSSLPAIVVDSFSFPSCSLIRILFMVQSHYMSGPYGTRWCKLAQNTWHPRMCIRSSRKIVRYLVWMFFFRCLLWRHCKIFNINAENPLSFYSSTVVYFTVADL